MLEIAYMHKDALQIEYMKAIMKPENFFYGFGSYHQYELKINSSSWDNIQFVSVTKIDDETFLNGYFCADVCRAENYIGNVSVIRFENSNKYRYRFCADMYKFLENLFVKYSFRKIEWHVVVGNPSEKMYDRIVEKWDGRIVGTFRQKVMLTDGNLYDQKHYEIFRDRYMHKKVTTWR